MIVAEPTSNRYLANLASADVEQGTLSQELSNRTSTLETDKCVKSNSWSIPLQRFGVKESYVAFCSELLSLTTDDDEDPVSPYALEVAFLISEKVFTRLGSKWRRPRLATDGGGGLRLTWRLGEKEIRAVIPASPNSPQYLYFEQGDKYYTVPNFTSITLCDKFEWLLRSDV